LPEPDQPKIFYTLPQDAALRSLAVVGIFTLLNLLVLLARNKNGVSAAAAEATAIHICWIGTIVLLYFALIVYALGWYGRVSVSKEGIEAINYRLRREFVPWTRIENLSRSEVVGQWPIALILGEQPKQRLYLLIFGKAKGRMQEAILQYANATNPLYRHLAKRWHN
jgi:hypothetical protein